MERQFLSKRSVAAFFDTSPSTISRWVEAGILGANRWTRPLARGYADARRRWCVEAQAGSTSTTREADQAAEDFINAQRARHQKKAR